MCAHCNPLVQHCSVVTLANTSEIVYECFSSNRCSIVASSYITALYSEVLELCIKYLKNRFIYSLYYYYSPYGMHSVYCDKFYNILILAGKRCMVYDVVFNPSTLEQGESVSGR